jgi:Protein of unknown function (DUF4246)
MLIYLVMMVSSKLILPSVCLSLCFIQEIFAIARIMSYINNLHPSEHSDLYTTIEKIIARCIPLWNATLTPLKSVHYRPLRITFDQVIFDPDEEDEGPHQEEGENNAEFYNRQFEWQEEVREVVHPEPGEFVPPPVRVDDVDLRRDFGSSGLQIIVKLANIQLTPEEPLYNGGSWHIEGQLVRHRNHFEDSR